MDKEKTQLNVRAIYYLDCALDKNKYIHICQCESTKGIWKLLEITEGINQVKESKINLYA